MSVLPRTTGGRRRTSVDAVAERVRALIEAHARTRDPQYLAPGATLRDVAQGRTFEGREAIGAMQRLLFLEAFSEGQAEVRTVAVDEASGIGSVEWVFRGRHTGDYLGIAATGQRVELPMLGVYEVVDDLIRRARIYYDLATLLRQMGRRG